MAVKTIIEIPINDSAFKRFYELFEEYQAELGEQPQIWRELGEEMDKSTKLLAGGAMTAKEQLALAAAQAGLVSEAIREAVREQNQLDTSVKKSGGSMGTLAQNTKSASDNASVLTKTLSTLPGWGKIAAVVIGGFAGAVDLANTAFSRYKSAGGLGLSTGQLSSFNINAQQFLGASALESAANSQSDVSKAGWMAALGIGYDQAGSMSSSDLAFAELKAAAQAYRADPRVFQNTAQGIAYMQLGGNMDDVRNAARHPGQLNAAWWRTNHDASALNVSDTNAQKMTDFKVAVDRAGAAIQTTLINGMAPVAPAFTHVVNGATDVANALDGKNGLAGAAEDTAASLRDLRDAAQGKTPAAKSGEEAWRDWKGGSVSQMAAALEYVANGVRHRLQTVFGAPTSSSNSARFSGSAPASWGVSPISGGSGPDHDILNMKIFDKTGSLVFARYGSTEEGVKANAKRLAEFAKVWDIKNDFADIIPPWNGHGKNSPQYIANVEKWSGVSRDLDMSKYSKEQFARVFSAMSRQEGDEYVTPEQVEKILWGVQPQAKPRTAAAPKAPTKTASRSSAPVHIAITNSTAARVAVSVNAAGLA